MAVTKDMQDLREERGRLGDGNGRANSDLIKNHWASKRALAERSSGLFPVSIKSMGLWGIGYAPLLGRIYF